MKRIFFAVWLVLFFSGINPLVGQSVFTKGSVWKYLDDGSDQGTAWKEVGFNDSTWKSGPAILGYGTIGAGAISTFLSYGGDENNKYPTTYFRSTFDYTASGDSNFVFNVLVDDGAVVYINGQEVFRIGITSGEVNYNTFASGGGNENAYQTKIVPIENIILSDTNVIAVEVHQTVLTSSDIGWDLEISTNNDPVNIPPVKDVSQIRFGSTGDPLNGLTVTWQSSGTSDSIAWGYTSKYEEGVAEGLRRENTFGNILFDYTFPSLKAGDTIHYALFDSKDSVWTEERTFHTASDASDNRFSFSVIGDSRTYPDQWKIISEAVLETDFTLFMGDVIADGAILSGWDDWFEYGEKFVSREPIYHCIGNHDEDNSTSGFDTYLSVFTLPGEETYYSFNYGNAIFICLNTEDRNNAAQYSWLLSTLEANKDQTWKFIFFHRPFYTSPSHVGEMDAYFNTWWKTFDDYGVDMLFHGHTHNYQRTKPINRNVSTTSPVAAYGSLEGMGRCQIVAGSAGPLSDAATPGLWWLEKSVSKRHFCNIDIDGDRLTFKAMDANHVIFDELILDKSTMGTRDFRGINSWVYPNPSNGEFYIKVPPGERFSYRIFNSVGKLITELQNSYASYVPVRIDLGNQPKGIYLIELRTGNESVIEKIIKF
ncbi:metallophosphoesterase [Bacteroidota bacterium]